MTIDQMALELCWQIDRCGASEDLTKASLMASALRMKLVVLITALGFYADQRNWDNNVVDIGVGSLEEPQSSPVANDHGHTAQNVLLGEETS